MAKHDDDILMGTEALTSKESRDSDGDGVSDAEEELSGTDPNTAESELRPLDERDPRGDLERPDLEREVGFDPSASMPDGKSITTGLDGMKDLDGGDLSKGPNHHGVDMGTGPDGHDVGNSPADMQRDPTASTPRPSGPPAGNQGSVDVAGGSTGGSSSFTDSGHGGAPPADADLSFRAPNMGLVSGEADGGTEPGPLDKAAKWVNDLFKGGDPPAPPDAGTKRPEGDTPVPKPKPKGPPKPGSDDDYYVNPDADVSGGGGPITDDEIDLAIVRAGGDTKPVEGHGAGPQIDSDAPPPNKRDLVTDPGDESGGHEDATSGAPQGRPDAPVVREINPDSGYAPPPQSGPGPSGGDGDGDMGRAVDHTAAAFGDDGISTIPIIGVEADHLGLDSDHPADGEEQDPGAFGGPLDDGFD